MITPHKKHRSKRLHGDRFQCATCGAVVSRDKAFIICEKGQLCTCQRCVEQAHETAVGNG
jgi:hypothetical protein